MSLCLHVSMSTSLHVSKSMSPCLHVTMSPCLHVSMSICLHVYVSMFQEFPKRKTELNRKRQFPFVCYKRKTETANFHLFAANENGKRRFVILGRQTINGNRRLLFQQTCPSMPIGFTISLPGNWYRWYWKASKTIDRSVGSIV
jgi:hypothetical protein